MPGDVLGTVLNRKYRLDGVLGMGAMGVVYRAVQLDAGGAEVREVAVKMIRPELLTLGPEITQRFLREIRAAARLRGPNAITVYDFGESASGDLYYVMELVEGPTLKDVLATAAPLSSEQAVAIGSQICAALDEAHHLSPPVLHRDLKPGNIFVEKWPGDVWVRVGDFGIAKVVGEETHGVTGVGWSPGAPGYMAPEQCRGTEIDARADLYSLGVVLYEALNGRPPFSGDAMTVMYQHVHEAPATLPGTVAPELRRLVSRLLEKDPAARPSSARQVQAELENLRLVAGASDTTVRRAVSPPGAHASGSARGRWARLAIGTGALLFVAAAIGFAWRFSQRESFPGRARSLPATTGGPVGDVPPIRSPPAEEDFVAGVPGVAVLEFRNERADDRQHDWIRTALQTTFSTELNKIRELRVLSRELIEGSSPASGPVLERLRKLGAKKLVSGSFAVLGDNIRVDARMVDVDSGLQEKSESIEGKVAEFFALQKRLALSMLERLPVRVSSQEREAIAERNPSQNQGLAVDAYRLMLQGEGLVGEEEEDEDEGDAAADDVHGALRPRFLLPCERSSQAGEDTGGGIFGLLSPAAAHAEENATEAEVRAVLEQYRVALETGDLDGIIRARGKLSEKRRKGLEQYFAMAEGLKVDFARIEIQRVDERHFAVSYVRRDQFSDRRTGERVDLEVQLENTAVHDGETWRIKNRKPLATK